MINLLVIPEILKFYILLKRPRKPHPVQGHIPVEVKKGSSSMNFVLHLSVLFGFIGETVLINETVAIKKN